MKKNMCFSIELDVSEEFKKKVKNMSEWVETKMREELGKTNYIYVQPPLVSKLEKFYRNILLPIYNFNISLTDLDREIKGFFGMDDRTKKKYKPLLFEYGYLSQSKFNGIFIIKRPYTLKEEPKETKEEKTEDEEIDNILGARRVEEHG